MPDQNTLITWATPVFFLLIGLEAWSPTGGGQRYSSWPTA